MENVAFDLKLITPCLWLTALCSIQVAEHALQSSANKMCKLEHWYKYLPVGQVYDNTSPISELEQRESTMQFRKQPEELSLTLQIRTI